MPTQISFLKVITIFSNITGKRKTVLLLGAFASIFSIPIKAQTTIGNTPLSRIGFGEYAPEGNTRSLSMGNTGIANYNIDHINWHNPALNYYNRVTNLEANFILQRKSMTNGSLSQLTGGGGPYSYNLSFPLSNRITAGAGLKSYSYIDYNQETDTKTTDGQDVQYQNRGTGGVSQASMFFASRISQKLTAGLDIQYLFGTLQKEQSFQFYPLSGNLIHTLIRKDRVGGFRFKPGLAFRTRIDTAKNIWVTTGLTADLGGNIGANRDLTFENQSRFQGVFTIDSVLIDRRVQYTLPNSIGFGIGLMKPLYWNWSAEGRYTAYSQYKEEGGMNIMRDAFSLSTGAELTPDPYKTNYLYQITYRLGAQLKQTPYVVNGNRMNDVSVSAGFGLPIIRKEARYTRPVINMAVVAGYRGSVDQNKFRENYIKFAVSVTLNDQMWFQRYRLD